MRCATALAVTFYMLSWSVSIYFVAVYPWNVHNNQK